MKLQLIVLSKDGINISTFEKERITVGRSSQNDLRLKNRFVSRRHFVIERQGFRYYLKSLSRHNQPFVDGQEVKANETVCLNDNAKIKLGDSIIEFSIIPEAAPAASSAPAVATATMEAPQAVGVGQIAGADKSGKHLLGQRWMAVRQFGRKVMDAPAGRRILVGLFLVAIVVGVGFYLLAQYRAIHPKTPPGVTKYVITATTPASVHAAYDQPVTPEAPARHMAGGEPDLDEMEALAAESDDLMSEDDLSLDEAVEEVSTPEPEPTPSAVKSPTPSNETVDEAAPEVTLYLKDGRVLAARFLGYQANCYIVKTLDRQDITLIPDKEVNKIVFKQEKR